MNQLFSTSSTYASLSLIDLIKAREDFHFHLMSKKNVVATAVGLYRIRKEEPWPHDKDQSSVQAANKRGKRTLFNSEVRPYSWPCIYVFVNDWMAEEELAKSNPADVVPKTIFTKHRAVPICVIETKKQFYSDDMAIQSNVGVARNLFGPGTLIVNKDAQGMARGATAGCVVRDGERYYVLTNKHAIGKPGTPIFAVKGSSLVEIGKTAEKGVTKKMMNDVYPSYNLERQYLQMDLGLVDLYDITQWKTEVAGIDNITDVLDLYDENFSLQLIGKKVNGRSAVTGMMRGEIHGLFYRYKSIGGYEYISDFLIGPDTTPSEETKEKDNEDIGFTIHHGDSGTLLFLENEETEPHSDVHIKRNYPFALLWGKHEFFNGREGSEQPFALATALSTASEILDVDYQDDINKNNDYVWGYVGHYAIASKLTESVSLLSSKKLRDFIKKNASLLSLDGDNIIGNDPKVIGKKADGTYDVKHPHFVPLADVPDNVWKSNVNFWIETIDDDTKKRHPGPGVRSTLENPNHFADIDLKYKNFEKFSDFVLSDPEKNLKPQVWMEYYLSYENQFVKWAVDLGKDEAGERKLAYKHWGALPFRVQQLFNIMKQAVKDGDQEKYLTAGGVLIHYIGDACQPLHTSYLSQGDPNDLEDKPNGNGRRMRADGVHGGYEDEMIEYAYTKQNLMDLIKDEVERQEESQKEKIEPIKTGLDAAKATMILAKSCQDSVSPRKIVDKWTILRSIRSHEKRSEQMWEDFGEGTVTCMARGCRYLAALWQAAWSEGEGDQTISNGRELKEADIIALYNNPDFAKSNSLKAYDLNE